MEIEKIFRYRSNSLNHFNFELLRVYECFSFCVLVLVFRTRSNGIKYGLAHGSMEPTIHLNRP